jgi:hypothetical protein
MRMWRRERGDVTLVTSKLGKDEFDQFVDTGSRPADVIYLLLHRVPLVDDRLVLPAPLRV